VIDPDKIIPLVADFFHVGPLKLVAAGRRNSVCESRHVAMYLMRLHTNLSLEEIGIRFNRDHTTIVHAVHRIAEAVEKKTLLGQQALMLSNDLMKAVTA